MPDRDIKLDLERQSRIGFDEAIFCAGKSCDQLTAILDQAKEATLLLTRLEQTALDALPEHHRAALNYEPVSRTAYFGNIAAAQEASRIAVITAGTSDTPASREAARTLEYYGHSSTEITDIGVAGLWRLTERVEEILLLRIADSLTAPSLPPSLPPPLPFTAAPTWIRSGSRRPTNPASRRARARARTPRWARSSTRGDGLTTTRPTTTPSPSNRRAVARDPSRS